MAATKSQRNAHVRAPASVEQHESPKELTHDIVEHLVEYAKQNPGYAALTCLGVGFVLGWKLKPW